MPYFPVTHSTLSADALLNYVQQHYEPGELIECLLLNPGLNDTYLLRGKEQPYILRVYRAGYRTLDDVLYEMDLLLHLHGKSVPVAYPLPMRDGRLVSTLNSLEGARPVALFTYAEGEPGPRPRGEAYSKAYGQAVADVHNALEDFSSQHKRFSLDLDHLLETPLRTSLHLFDERPDDKAYLLRLGEQLRERALSLPLNELEWGACHGDFHGGNAHLTPDRQVVFFDFDCCGPGWRAYDIAVFRWARILNQQDMKLWEAFLEGYTERRTLRPLDMQAIPLFVALRQYWLLGLHARGSRYWGHSFIDQQYLDRHMNLVKQYENELEEYK